MSLPPDLEAKHAWRGALVGTALNVVGLPGDILLAHDIPNMPWYPSLGSALVGAGLLAILLLRRQRATVRLGSVVFLLNTAVVLVALWISSGYWAASGRSWVPFQANKLGALAVPLLAPRLAVGLLAIAGFAGTAIAKFYFLAPSIRLAFPVGEPWIILVFAFFGCVLLAYRLHGLALEREMLRLHAEAEAAEQLARAFLRLRDHANTPIQTIAFTTEYLKARDPDLGVVLGRLERALGSLRELSQALLRYESAHQWRPGDESPDPKALVESLPKRR